MHNITAADLADIFQQLSNSLAQYEGNYAALEQRLHSLEREARDRQAILDRFAIISEADTRGIITYANSKFCEVSGYSLEELVGKPHNIIRHPDMPKAAFKDLWDTIKAGKIWQGEVKNRRKDGSAYWVLATVGPLLDAEGYPYRYISIRVDITKQKELEEKLRSERDILAKDLMDNLELAHLIQTALLPQTGSDESSFSTGIPYFTIWRPLQIVSGDFFWSHEDRGRLLIFLGDSVGHGMAGGLIATLFLQELRHQVIDKGIWAPERLAEELDQKMGYLFRRKLPLPVTIDGTILLIDQNRMKLSYIALRGKGFLSRKGELIPLERYPFSFGDFLGSAAYEHSLVLMPGDRIYLYSDGISDQQNPEGKKFGTKRIENLITELSTLPFSLQRERVESVLREWQGDKPQADDILFLGIEIPAK
ncbi:MAG: PAS domain S-box protein [Bacteroidia bacterium]|nr:PAS domain S-box protein [Bacteroidia bacterium]MDW8416654.1 PAS domain S-box protein [Bacteroidia bacterium]